MLLPAPFDIYIERGIAYGPLVITVYDDIPPPEGTGTVVDLTGYGVHAHARRISDDTLLQDLAPVITDAVGGEITIGKFTDEDTLDFKPVKNGKWSLVLESSSGDWLPAIVAGAYSVTTSVTRNQP